jgi:hypothetical protein
MSYFNPDGVVVKEGDRSVIVRFKTEEDMIEFIQKTGIEITPKIKTLAYPIKDISKLFL